MWVCMWVFRSQTEYIYFCTLHSNIFIKQKCLFYISSHLPTLIQTAVVLWQLEKWCGVLRSKVFFVYQHKGEDPFKLITKGRQN